MKSYDNKGRVLAIVLSFIVLIAMGVAVIIHHNEKIQFKNISMLRQKQDNNGTNYIKCRLFSNIGSENYVMMEMAIPYENKTQYADLNRKIGRIKSDMLTNINPDEMNKWVKERDYVAIKSELLKVINKHTKEPIKHIYFDSFLYQ
jgi:flagellar basal body-associated protein FliL